METITNEAIVKKLVESEAGRKAAATIQRDFTAERMDLKSQAEKLRKEKGKQGRELADATEAAHARMIAARKALTEAEAEHGQAAMAQAQHKAHYTARIQKLQRQLTETAPAAIDKFLGWLDDQETVCKETGIIENARVTDKINTHTSEAVREYFTNAATLRDRMAAIRVARAEAESMKNKILEADVLQQHLDTLRESLPAVVMQFSYEK